MRLTQKFKGKWFVIYPDNAKSEPMFYDTAKGYANIFGGCVKHISERARGD